MAKFKENHPHDDAFDSSEGEGQTYELTSPSHDGLQSSAADGDGSGDDASASGSSQTFISDEFEATPADSRTIQSDEFDAEPGAESKTFVSDEFEPASADSKTIQSDEFDASPADSKTVQSDEFDEPGAESKTFVSDEFEPAAADSKTIQSDEFDDVDSPDATLGSAPEIDKTYVSEEFDAPRWGDTGAATMMVDVGGTNEDSRTVQSDQFGDDDAGLMAQSNVRQTINPKSMDSNDRKHWDSVIRGALGSQAVPSRRKRDSSQSVGIGSALNIQTRTLVEGQPAPGVSMDYRIETKLGEGGMGAVYLANQTSLNRNVALKVIKPISDKESKRLKQSGRLQTVREHREGQFLSEAVVTGDLEHPNIVPIYDVAATQDGTVFYSMKCVSGTPWSKAIKKRKLHENVDILLKVCDALAFAHSRGVVHRDLKPENVMLGEFGVVLVMDWGLALTTGDFTKNGSIKKASSLGGSPAYMAPELATGPLDRIGPAADIYLIGAMLYEIITGRPPHSGSNVSQCLRAAATNKIDDAPAQAGELMDIAQRAMATKIEDRYTTVQAFQEAVRGYLAHAESVGIAAKARADLRSARDTQEYSDYARAMFGFEQALDLWDGNDPARQGLSQAQLEYAELALKKTDYELGLSLLSAKDPAHEPIVGRLRAAQQEQENRKHRLAWMKRIAAGLLAVIFVGGSGALAIINQQKNQAVALKQDAEDARDAAVVSEGRAKVARDAAVVAQRAAEVAAEQERIAKLAEAKLKTEAIALKDQALKSAEAEKVARVAAVEAQKRAEEAQKAAELAAQQEKLAKLAEAEQRKKAEESALAEKQAKDAAVLAAAAEKKAKEDALLAKEAETKAKETAVAAEKVAVDERKKAELAALAEKQAKELETKAKVAAIEAEKLAVAERMKAEAAAEAEKKAKELETQAKLAAVAAQKAEEQAKLAAVAAREAETKAKDAAIAAEKQAVYEAYVAKIGLVKSRIDQNEFDGARTLLIQLKQDQDTKNLCGWEWSFLMNQASQSASDVSADQPARDVSLSETGRQAVAVAEGGQVELLDVATDGTMAPRSERRLLLGHEAYSAAISDAQNLIATGEAAGDIRLWSRDSGRELRKLSGHQGEVTRVRFLPGGQLLSASVDKTLRVWDPATGRELATAWHIAPVQNLAFSGDDSPVIAAAVADSRSGRVAVWQLQNSGGRTQLTPVGDFVGHGAPVLSVAVSRDGRQVASGDGAGRIYLWERSGVKPLDYGAAIDSALTRITGTQRGKSEPVKPTSFTSFTDDEHPLGTLRLIGDKESVAHTEAVRSLAFSGDARRLVSSADDFTIKVWDPAGRGLLQTLRGHGGWVRSVAFSPVDDDVVLSAGYDRSIKSWKLSKYTDVVLVSAAEASAGKPAAGSPEVQAHDDEIWSARFSRDGSRLVTTSRDRSARLWTIQTGGPRMHLQGPVILTDETGPAGPKSLVEGHRYLALSFHASPDGRQLYIGGVDGSIKVFDVRRGTEVASLPGNGLNMGFAVSADGRQVLAASSDRDAGAQLWELNADGSAPDGPRLKLAGHEHPVTAYAISADGKRLYTGDQRGIGRLWDATTGEAIGSPLTYHEGLRINDATFLPDGRLLTGADDLTLAIYDPAQGGAPQKIRQPGFVSMLDLSPDGRHVLSLSERTDVEKRATVTTLLLTDLSTGGPSQPVMDSSSDGPQLPIRSARFAADGQRVITAHGSYESQTSFLRLWQLSSDGRLQPVRMLKLPKKLPAADAAVLLPNQAHELVTLHGAAAYQWDLNDLEHHQSYRSHGSVTDAGFSADGKFVATCSEAVKIWDAVTGKPLFKLEAPHAGVVYSVEFTPAAGKYLFVTAGADGVARLWEWLPQQQDVAAVRTFAAAASAGNGVRDAVFSHDGVRLLTVGDGGTCKVWNIDSETPLAVLSDPDATQVGYVCGAFSDDGRLVVVGAADKLARLWKVDDAGLSAAANPPLSMLVGHADRVESVAFLPAAAGDTGPPRVLTASRDRSARAWDATTGREVISLRKHSLGLTAVDATRVGPSHETVLVLTASLDGRVILWPAGP